MFCVSVRYERGLGHDATSYRNNCVGLTDTKSNPSFGDSGVVDLHN